jgi:hypothetical protein
MSEAAEKALTDRTRRNLREQIDFEAEQEREARAWAAEYLTSIGNMLATGPKADVLRRARRVMRMWEDRAEQHRASHAMLLAAYTDS